VHRYYNVSYTNSPVATADTPTNPPVTPPGFVEILIPGLTTDPPAETATPSAWFEDQTGFGGFQTAGVDLPINTMSPNEDALIIGFSTKQARFLYTGNDIIPFAFFIINSELGSGSTFSAINMDEGVLTRGNRGYIITGQTNAKRFDLDIPDQIFQMQLVNNGPERFCSQRDFINEWVYFTYNANSDNSSFYAFPNQTLQYNYRDNSWAIFNESYTTYGSFRPKTGLTWNDLPATSWNAWNGSWDTGGGTLLQPIVIGGNQQGFILLRNQENETSEEPSLSIQNIVNSTITVPNHGLNVNDYFIITGVLDSLLPDTTSYAAQVNGKIFSVGVVIDANNIMVNPALIPETYYGGGIITRMYVPFIQTKQFPTSWQFARKTRLGPQQYLFTQTVNAQVTVNIYLSQDDSTPWNAGTIIPDPTSMNNSLIYSAIVYTCRESTNLGLTPANTNLHQLTAISLNGTSNNTQQQIWHRMNTSMIGDTIQLGITLSDAQMRGLDANGNLVCQFAEIEFHAAIFDMSPSWMLS